MEDSIRITTRRKLPLEAEGNKYYDVNKCGIGFHGDTERKKVTVATFGESREIH